MNYKKDNKTFIAKVTIYLLMFTYIFTSAFNVSYNEFKFIEMFLFVLNVLLAYCILFKNNKINIKIFLLSLANSIALCIVIFVEGLKFEFNTFLQIFYLNNILVSFICLYTEDFMKIIIKKIYYLVLITSLYVLFCANVTESNINLFLILNSFFLLNHFITFIMDPSTCKGRYITSLLLCLAFLVLSKSSSNACFLLLSLFALYTLNINTLPKKKSLFTTIISSIIIIVTLVYIYNVQTNISEVEGLFSFINILFLMFSMYICVRWIKATRNNEKQMLSIYFVFNLYCTMFDMSLYESFPIVILIYALNSLPLLEKRTFSMWVERRNLVKKEMSHMSALNLEDIKRITFEMLKIIHNKCEENNLRYYLAGGTLLGAVRHKGFIPWDDDLDISMPRKDYVKLKSIINNDIKLKKYHCFSTDDVGYMYSFMKFVDLDTIIIEDNELYDYKGNGIFIDIFPIDGLGDDREKAIRLIKLYSKLSNFLFTSFNPYFTRRKKLISKNIMIIKGLICELLGSKVISLIINKITNKYDFDHSRYIGSAIAGRGGVKELFPQSAFANTIDIEFEGEIFKAPCGWEIYLLNLYGDYMKLPPEDQRKTDHSFKAYWKSDAEKGEQL